MASSGRDCKDRTVDAFQPISEMLDVGQCEPLKAAVHGVLFATVAVCAAYNAAAWLKRRQPHLAINAVVYGAAVCGNMRTCMHHLVECGPAKEAPFEEAGRAAQDARAAEERDAA